MSGRTGGTGEAASVANPTCGGRAGRPGRWAGSGCTVDIKKSPLASTAGARTQNRHREKRKDSEGV